MKPIFVFWITVLLLIIAAALCVNVPAHAAKPAVIRRPNLDIGSYRRSYTPSEHVAFNLSTYNLKVVTLSVYRFDLNAAIKTPKDLSNLPDIIHELPLSAEKPIVQWTAPTEHFYPDAWRQNAVNAPLLQPGNYVIAVRGMGVEKRTWFCVTRDALVVKRAPERTLVWAVDAVTGRPQTGLSIRAVDSRSKTLTGRTNSEGIWSFPTHGLTGAIWLYGTSGQGDPIFSSTAAIEDPYPISVYAFTDRPIYRPGQTVQYTGTVRSSRRTPGPNGFTYTCFANHTVDLEVRDSTDALIDKETVKTNTYGSYKGNLKIGPECPLGNWQIVTIIDDHRFYTQFDVEAYRKPEFTASATIDKSYYFGGDKVPVTISAQFYFGQPVPGAKVSYNVSFGAGSNSDGSLGSPEQNYTGTGATNNKGQLTIDIPTLRLPFDRTVTVNADVTDLSRRTQSVSASTTITAGRFRLNLSSVKTEYLPGEHIEVTLHSADYDNIPVSTSATLQMTEQREDSQHRPYNVRTTRKVVTNKSGDATEVFDAVRPGTLTFDATAFDSDDNKITSGLSVDVQEPGSVTNPPPVVDQYPDISLTSDQNSYNPGDTAVLTLQTGLVYTDEEIRAATAAATKAHPRGIMPREEWALITVEGEAIYKQFLLGIHGHETSFKIPLTMDYTPSISISAVIVQGRQIYSAQQPLSVERDQEKLNVTITPDKTDYRPGDTATYKVVTTDYQGNPVPAEVALGVVDASIYDIAQDSTPNMHDFFYGGQPVQVNTDFSFAAQYSGGAYQTIAGAADTSANAPDGIRVRKQFADTAYWNPMVDTGQDGTASVKFTMPDNLTSWRATSHASTLATQVGQSTADVTSSMPLLVRLELPRFGVQHDQFVVSGIVQNCTKDPKTVVVHLDADGVTLPEQTTQTIQLDPGSQKRIDWKVGITSSTTARFRVTADGGPGAQDAMELNLPTLPDGVKNITAQCDTLEGDNTKSTLDLSALPDGATVQVTLAPSVASAAFDALDYLTTYPYGCAEQTTSALVPDISVERALNLLHANRHVQPDLHLWVSLSLQKLYFYQHADGGWQWWEFDDSDPDMTAYVLWGLVQTRDAGFLVDDQRIARGAGYLQQALKDEREWNRRADWLLPLAFINPGYAARPLKDLYDHRDKLDTYGLASLALSMSQAGGSLTPLTNNIAQELESKAEHRGRMVFWPAGPGIVSWRSDDACITSHVLRALLAVNPHEPLAAGAIRWLLADRDNEGAHSTWSSTRTTAEAVYALCAYMKTTGELSPSYTANITIDGAPIGKPTTFKPDDAFSPPTTINLTTDQLRGHKSLTIERIGTGILYSTFVVHSVIEAPTPGTQDTSASSNSGLSVVRSYQISSPDPSTANVLGLPQEMDVTVTVSANTEYKYVMLEEPIPAGCEAIDDGDSGMPQQYGVRREVRDDRIVYFFDDLPSGDTQLSYKLITQTPGSYRIIPGTVSLVYAPEVRGRETFSSTKIVEDTDSKEGTSGH